MDAINDFIESDIQASLGSKASKFATLQKAYCIAQTKAITNILAVIPEYLDLSNQNGDLTNGHSVSMQTFNLLFCNPE